MAQRSSVRVWRESVVFPTYEPHPPDKNPMFVEKRVYQGSSGRIYPLPFYDRIAEQRTDRSWDAIYLENEYIRVMILPEIGGRIHVGQDKTNGYDFFYRQNVIKPALVGLAGPWISGGVEFNWPQHHRPATFMPVDVEIEEHADGSITVWCSDHDPMARMKGMHGVCLHPGSSLVELKVRAYNRTTLTQTFLWWANVATRVHEQYQSFFPPDVYYVADHAKRAMSEFPLCQGHYYGVDYGRRSKEGIPSGEAPDQFVPPGTYAANDLSWYANIPVPTSYMCMGTSENFFGGYDHARGAGVVHVANHHISPGKKQWTWGNHRFGYAWDRHLTDADGPYIELMAGVYTDNQPDFSFLQPGETKTWSQFWYPIQQIGPAQQANTEAAVSLSLAKRDFQIGVSVTRNFHGATIRLERVDGSSAAEWIADLAPGQPFTLHSPQAETPWRIGKTMLRVLEAGGREIITFQPVPRVKGLVPPAATEPPAPADIASADELYFTGMHLEQYRHATRSPVDYWMEALRRDPGDARCNQAMGLWHLRRGEFAPAEDCLRTAIDRITRRNPNPPDGDAYYYLGITLRYLDRLDEAYAAFYKSVWNQAWQSAGYFALAEIDCLRADWTTALDHLERSLRFNTDHLAARNLRVMVLRKLGRDEAADIFLRPTLALDPLDWWARDLAGFPLTCNTQTHFDLAIDLGRSGWNSDAIRILQEAKPEPGTAPLIQYYLGWMLGRAGDAPGRKSAWRKAAKASPDYCFPARLEEMIILEAAIKENPDDAQARYFLGNWLYDRRRHREAMVQWEKSARREPSYAVVWRNLGIAFFNVSNQPGKARTAYDRALRANPDDARLLFERDQLWKRCGESPARRLKELEKHPWLIGRRDDLSVEICALYNQAGQPEKALEILASRQFQPWEGGEGQALGQYIRTMLALGRAALARGDAAAARTCFEQAIHTPENLGECRHLLANQSDVHYWLGEACAASGDADTAVHYHTLAATFRGDFQEMSVRSWSEMTYYSALALRALGRTDEARAMLEGLLAYSRELEKAPARIDYFATSLPTMLLFEDDLPFRQATTAYVLRAQALLGLGRRAAGRKLLVEVLQRDPNHALAADLLHA